MTNLRDFSKQPRQHWTQQQHSFASLPPPTHLDGDGGRGSEGRAGSGGKAAPAVREAEKRAPLLHLLLEDAEGPSDRLEQRDQERAERDGAGVVAERLAERAHHREGTHVVALVCRKVPVRHRAGDDAVLDVAHPEDGPRHPEGVEAEPAARRVVERDAAEPLLGAQQLTARGEEHGDGAAVGDDREGDGDGDERHEEKEGEARHRLRRLLEDPHRHDNLPAQAEQQQQVDPRQGRHADECVVARVGLLGVEVVGSVERRTLHALLSGPQPPRRRAHPHRRRRERRPHHVPGEEAQQQQPHEAERDGGARAPADDGGGDGEVLVH